MNLTQDTAKQIFALLKQEGSHAANMLKLLKQEYQALRDNDFDGLDKIISAKQEQAALLDGFESKLTRVHLLPDEFKKLPALISFIEEGRIQALGKAWAELQNTLRLCQDQNIANNQLIEASRTYLQESLSILRGSQFAKPTYQASGKSASASTGQTLAYA